MKYAIIGDIHGADLSRLEKVLNFEKPDCLICTGDFDQTLSIHQFKRLEKKFQKSGKMVIKVAGNHDHAILNNIEIISDSINSQGKSFSELYNELIRDQSARKYVYSKAKVYY